MTIGVHKIDYIPTKVSAVVCDYQCVPMLLALHNANKCYNPFG